MILGSLRYYIYIAFAGGSYRISHTHNPLLDLAYLQCRGYRELVVIAGSLNIGQAFLLVNGIASDREQAGIFITRHDKKSIMFHKKRLLNKLRKKFKLEIEVTDRYYASGTNPADIPYPFLRDEMEKYLSGRILLSRELYNLLEERKHHISGETEDILQILFLEHRCLRTPAVGWDTAGKLICFRCGQASGITAVRCTLCGGECFYCRECQSMGEARLCEPLYAVPARKKSSKLPVKKINPFMSKRLSEAQKYASSALRQFILQPEQREKLVWAACGAGKTEVVFEAMGEVLSRDGNVLFALPRRMPLDDITSRVKAAFPDFQPVCLHGKSLNKYSFSKIVISTTHQAVRFYSTFDLIIVDEVDAYPFTGSGMLGSSITRARKKAGKIIYMTATPTGELYARYKKGNLPCIKIPARFHGYPLPVPKISVLKNLRAASNKIVIPEEIINIIHESIEGDLSQLLIFVPTVTLSISIGEELKRIIKLPPFNNFSGSWVQYTHSRDEEREEKRDCFYAGEFPVLVTTTLFERGITVDKVNVAVIFADYEDIFTDAELIQMAGRCGRTESNPVGKVWFFACGVSRSMKSAVIKIKELNIDAWERGFLKSESRLWIEGWEGELKC